MVMVKIPPRPVKPISEVELSDKTKSALRLTPAKPEELEALLSTFGTTPISSGAGENINLPKPTKKRKVHGKKYRVAQPAKPKHKKGKKTK